MVPTGTYKPGLQAQGRSAGTWTVELVITHPEPRMPVKGTRRGRVCVSPLSAQPGHTAVGQEVWGGKGMSATEVPSLSLLVAIQAYFWNRYLPKINMKVSVSMAQAFLPSTLKIMLLFQELHKDPSEKTCRQTKEESFEQCAALLGEFSGAVGRPRRHRHRRILCAIHAQHWDCHPPAVLHLSSKVSISPFPILHICMYFFINYSQKKLF
ncbi:uncharacterized protein [Haliaeetus albicilla]|uniref:uncharacterized protein n=1 Tax=Haliaeetus albicilla TaxID=8969 RepID=UPI0037E813EB